MTVGCDQNDVGMRLSFYGLNESIIPKGIFILIKEPYYKEANDLLPIIRVDQPKDAIFFAEGLFKI